MEKIEGLSIDLDLDTAKLDRGLTGAKDKLRAVNSEMKANMSAFDYGERSVDKYESKLHGLNKKLEAQKRVTGEAKNHYEDMVSQYGEGSAEAEKAASDYNKQAGALNNLQRHVEKTAAELEELKEQQRIANSGWTKTGKALESTGNKITRIGGGLQAFGKKWTKMSAIAVGAVAGIGFGLYKLTSKVAENADEIQLNADKASMGAEKYQEWSYWAKKNGIEQSSFNKIVQRSNQRISEARNGNEKYTNALKQMGFTQDEINNMDTSEMYEQIIKKLSGMKDESKRTALATEFFGKKTARELLPALKKGATGYDEAKKEARKYGIVLSGEQIEAAQKFSVAQDSVKAAIGGIAAQIGLKLLPYFSKMLNWVQGHIPQIKNTIENAFDNIANTIKTVVSWFSNLSSSTKKAIGIFAGIAAALGPVSIALGGLMKIFGPFVTIVGKAFQVVGRLGGLLPVIKAGMVALTGPVGLTVAAVAGLTAGFIALYTKSETVRNAIHKVVGVIKGMFALVTGHKGEAVSILNRVGMSDEQIQAIIGVVNKVKSLISAAIGAVVNFAKSIGAELSRFWDENGAQITQALQNMWSIAKPILQGILSVVKAVMPVALQIVKNVWSGIKDAIQGAIKIIEGIIQVFSGIFTADFSQMWKGIKKIFSGYLQAVWGLIKTTFIGQIILLIGSFAKKFWNAIKSLWDKVKNTTSNVLHAVWNWIKNGFVGKTITTIINFGKNALKWIRNAWSNIKKNTVKALGAVWTWIKNSFIGKTIRGYIRLGKQVFKFIKNAWSNIKKNTKSVLSAVWRWISKGFIGKTIKGIINFGKKAFKWIKNTWGNVKKNTVKVLRATWNWISKGFIGKTVKGIVNFGKKSFKWIKDTWHKVKKNTVSVLKAVWHWISKGFIGKTIKGIINFGKKAFKWIKDTWYKVKKNTVNTLKAVWKWIKNSFIGKTIKNIINFGKDALKWIRDTWRKVKKNTVDTLSAVWKWIKNSFIGRTIKKIINFSKDAIKWIKNAWKGVKTKTSNMLSNVREWISDSFIGKTIKFFKDLPGNIADKVKKGASKVKGAFKSLGNSMLRGIEKPLNGIRKGFKNVLNWVHAPKSFKKPFANKWALPRFAKGTDGTKEDGPAVVSDGKGPNKQELISTPKGETFLSPKKKAVVDLPKGSSVLDGNSTAQLLKSEQPPQYAGGVGFLKGAWNKAKEVSKNIWDYATKPIKVIKAGIGKHLNLSKTAGMAGGIAKGMATQIPKAAKSWIKGMLGFGGGDGGGMNPFKGWRKTSTFGNRKDPITGSRAYHSGIDFANTKGTPIKAARGGRVVHAGPSSGGYGNYVMTRKGGYDIVYGHMSKVAAKQGQGVSAGDVIGNVGSTGRSTGPHTHFEARKAGTMDRVDPSRFLKSGGGGTGGKAPKGNLAKWISAGMAKAGVSGSNWRSGLNYIIQRESSGNPKAVGAPTSSGRAKGLMQLKGFNINGDPLNPINNISAGIKYIKNRPQYGTIGKAVDWWKKHQWYASGGKVTQDGMYRLAEEGHPEWVIPSDPKRHTEAQKLLALAGKDIEGGNKRPQQLPSVSGGSSNTESLELMQQQIDQQNTMIKLLTQIAAKDFSIGKDDIADAANESNALKALGSFF